MRGIWERVCWFPTLLDMRVVIFPGPLARVSIKLTIPPKSFSFAACPRLLSFFSEKMSDPEANESFGFDVEIEEKGEQTEESSSATEILKRIKECFGEGVGEAFEGKKF